jgi:hypothetical protein
MIKNEKEFGEEAMEIFHYQREHNPIFRRWTTLLNKENPTSLFEIPFLPIDLFKKHEIKTGNWMPKKIYLSSGTTASTRSKHLLKDIEHYQKNSTRGFEEFFGNIKKYKFFALLPSYLENGDSSLVHMMQMFMEDENNFYLHDFEKLEKDIIQCIAEGKTPFLMGVTYALLDFAEGRNLNLSEGIICETGGMKGKRKEMSKLEVHAILKKAFQVSEIQSEYGMTELLSQAWSTSDAIYNTSSTMKVLIKDPRDPFTNQKMGARGIVNIIDLANIHTCSFIATQDLGRLVNENQFEILGRIDDSDLRGCNLLVD